MRKTKYVASLFGVSLLSGCASIDFGGEGLTYYDPKPYLFVSKTDKCVSSATVINVPGQKKIMKFGSGYGSSDLSATFSNNMVTAVGQKNDSKIPEIITSVAALATATLTGASACNPTATLYPLINGVPDTNSPINLLAE